MLKVMDDENVKRELLRIAAENGGILKAEEVVNCAESESSPLHKFFDWDDSEAAVKWRLEQARNLINVTVEYLPSAGSNETISVKVFQNLSTDRCNAGGGYRISVDVLDDRDLYARLVQDAINTMNYFCEKYASIKQLKKVISEMRLATNRLKKVIRR
jgi:hypothetical protein